MRYLRSQLIRSPSAWAMAVSVAAVIGLAAQFYTSRRADEISSQSSLTFIGSAIARYRETLGCYPPAFISDEQGIPAHSWRVLILPFCDNEELYERYDFEEPWDGPNNSRLSQIALRTAERLFAHPSDRSKHPDRTGYLALETPTGLWSRRALERPVSTYDLLLVEVANSGVHWMQPKDCSGEVLSSLYSRGRKAYFQQNYALSFGGLVIPIADATETLPPVQGDAKESAMEAESPAIKRMISSLQERLRSDRWIYRHQAAMLLGELGSRAKARQNWILGAACGDDDEFVRKAAEVALRKICGK